MLKRKNNKILQGYVPSFSRKLLRYIAKSYLKIFRVSGDTIWGNIVMQQFEPIIEITNIIDPSLKLKFHAGHERLHWRIKKTSKLDYLYRKMLGELDSYSVLFDIGANIGLTSLLPAQALKCKVFAFEPEPLNFANLHKNVFENRLQKTVSCFPIALSNSNSLRSFYLKTISPGDALHSIDYPSPQVNTRNLQDISSQEILTFSLDSLISIFKLPIPTHCKIDVDGAEMSVLEGMKETLMYAEKLSLYIELDLDDASGNFIGVCQYLKKMNFDLLEVAMAETVHSPNIRNCLFKKL